MSSKEVYIYEEAIRKFLIELNPEASKPEIEKLIKQDILEMD
jgi:hypothetical protein